MVVPPSLQLTATTAKGDKGAATVLCLDGYIHPFRDFSVPPQELDYFCDGPRAVKAPFRKGFIGENFLLSNSWVAVIRLIRVNPESELAGQRLEDELPGEVQRLIGSHAKMPLEYISIHA